jgi:TolB-like protein
MNPGSRSPAMLREIGYARSGGRMNRKHLRASALVLIALAAAVACMPPSATSVERRRAADEFARRALAAEQTIAPESLPPRTVGVAPLGVTGGDTTLAPLAYGLADLLMTDLSRSSQLHVVDRLRLDALLRELQLVASGRVDTATAPRVGKLVGARNLVVGSMGQQPPAGRIAFDVRLANAATGEIRSAVSASSTLDDILAAEKELAFRIFDQLGVNLTPAERALVEQRATQNLAALLAYSRGVRYEVEGRFDAAAREYQTALRLDPSFARAGARLGTVQTVAPRAPEQLARVSQVATERVNATAFQNPVAAQGAADPAFPSLMIRIVITVTTPP